MKLTIELNSRIAPAFLDLAISHNFTPEELLRTFADDLVTEQNRGSKAAAAFLDSYGGSTSGCFVAWVLQRGHKLESMEDLKVYWDEYQAHQGEDSQNLGEAVFDVREYLKRKAQARA